MVEQVTIKNLAYRSLLVWLSWALYPKRIVLVMRHTCCQRVVLPLCDAVVMPKQVSSHFLAHSQFSVAQFAIRYRYVLPCLRGPGPGPGLSVACPSLCAAVQYESTSLDYND